MFDPALAGYWGSSETKSAMDACLQIIKANSEKIDGIKISLLSKEAEITMRRQLPKHVRMYTGDDFNYAELIAGDDQGYSDALLGIFDAIAPVVQKESIDFEKAWFQSRYHLGSDSNGDYLNCPLNKIQYENFIQELLNSEVIEFKEWEKNTPYFEGCMPIEEIAKRGIDCLLYTSPSPRD